ncbi:protein tyrosine kinase [Oesophagostomum dentatum]|uniref:receptor protein-tyrosine kinase n=1 Tax=Oesophagostomum dentatum TaxID=61180 RepID=A0A0B1STS1_OESDE|nr:protein tyrosine kinase [Oesophagostomum dentatum]
MFQVFEDFLNHVAWKVSLEAALELAALKICRDHLEKQVRSCLDHKIDIDSVDLEAAMQTFIPKTVLCTANTKPSALKRQFIQLLKKFAPLPATESVLRSLSILIDIVKFDVEVFKASMGLITVATHDIAESLAHLIDGYQMMYNQGSSVYKMKDLMKNLQHENIISLIGVCMDAPMWRMELAPLGELRQYLQSNRASLSLTSLFLYSLQVARAICYLHGKSLVHRDIAARNVLVSTPKCVQLKDFGLSRALDYDAIYTASRGKLPIKWLAPESINYREFSMASDIWMYGVCVWEILSWGAKPWQGVPNVDVITRVESGARLPCPDGCPIALYNYLELMVWALQPAKRPTAKEIVSTAYDPTEEHERVHNGFASTSRTASNGSINGRATNGVSVGGRSFLTRIAC